MSQVERQNDSTNVLRSMRGFHSQLLALIQGVSYKAILLLFLTVLSVFTSQHIELFKRLKLYHN
jgi:hypothetical protein